MESTIIARRPTLLIVAMESGKACPKPRHGSSVPSIFDWGVEIVETFGLAEGGVGRPAPNNPPNED
jgi:hypothetical protein